MPEPTKDTNNLGARLKALRVQRGHASLEKFAYQNNISRVLYSNYEAGKGNPTFKNLMKISRALDITMTDMFIGV